MFCVIEKPTKTRLKQKLNEKSRRNVKPFKFRGFFEVDLSGVAAIAVVVWRLSWGCCRGCGAFLSSLCTIQTTAEGGGRGVRHFLFLHSSEN